MAAPPIPPDPGGPSWGFLEWTLSTLSVVVMAIGGYMMRTIAKLTQHTARLDNQEKDIEGLKAEDKQALDRFASRPTREDVKSAIDNLHVLLETRFEQFNARFDRLDSRIDSIINRK